MTPLRCGRYAALLLALLCTAVGARADDQPLWEAGIGAGGLRLPHYRGSDESRSWVLPVPFFVYRGKFLRADRDGARAVLFDGDRFDFDLSLSGSPPTQSGGDSARQGMPDLDPSIEIGPKLNVRLGKGEGWKLSLRLPVRAVVTLTSHPQHIGWNVEPVLNADIETGGFNIGLLAGPLWGDRRLNGTVYDVAPAYATATRPAYSAPGGYAGWQATAGFSRRVGRLWLGGYVRRDSVAGAVFENSPLVRSTQTTSLGFAMAWVFATSDKRVADEY
jgi:outer membrane scaffolding protein for murein synthesis (MipA/OmpV family)